VSDHYRNDFQLFWHRTNFFLLIYAGLFGFFVSKAFNVSSIQSFQVIVCIAGSALSLIWFLVSLSSINWIDVWRNEVVRIDRDINPYRSFSSGEEIEPDKWKFHLKMRPEVVSAGMPVIFFLAWVYMLLFPLN